MPEIDYGDGKIKSSLTLFDRSHHLTSGPMKQYCKGRRDVDEKVWRSVLHVTLLNMGKIFAVELLLSVEG